MESRKHVDAPPRVSVIIPVYNAAPYLRRCLDSVCGQTFRNIEIICVDDGSTDGSAAILAACAARDVRVRVLSQANRGQGSARNHGMRTACGEYIYFVDADDELAQPDAVERIAGMMDAQSLDLALFDAETRYDDGCEHLAHLVRSGAYVRRHDYSAVRSGMQMLADMCHRREWTASPPLAMLRRDLLEKSGIVFPEGFIYEDNVFMLRVFMAAKRATHVPWRLYVRKVHANTTTTAAVTIENLKGYLFCWQHVRNVLASDKDRRLPRRVRRALESCGRRFKWHVCNVARRLGEPLDSLYSRIPDCDANDLRIALHVSFTDKIGNALQCFHDNGFVYTIRRILFGRRL